MFSLALAFNIALPPIGHNVVFHELLKPQRYTSSAPVSGHNANTGRQESATAAKSVMADDNSITLLHATLAGRDTPEAVAELVGRALPPRQVRHLQVFLQARLTGSVKQLTQPFPKPVAVIAAIAE